MGTESYTNDDSGDAEPDFELMKEAPKIFKAFLKVPSHKRDTKMLFLKIQKMSKNSTDFANTMVNYSQSFCDKGLFVDAREFIKHCSDTVR